MSSNINVKWIKIYTNMVSNKKIRRIRTLPEGNNIILIWVFLIAQAGESNKNGALYLTDTIPFTPEDLAIEFDFEISVIKFALITLEKYSMVEVFDDVIYIKNWGEYQNIDGLEKIQIQNRDRKRKERANSKLLSLEDKESRDSHVTVTQSHATDIDKDLDIEIDKEVLPSNQKNKFSDDAIEIELACELYNLILLNNETYKKPNLQTWAKHIDLMIRVDKRNTRDISTVIKWSQQDTFWKTNILSTTKLREKYDQLTVKMKSEKQPKQGTPSKKTPSNKYDSFYN